MAKRKVRTANTANAAMFSAVLYSNGDKKRHDYPRPFCTQPSNQKVQPSGPLWWGGGFCVHRSH